MRRLRFVEKVSFLGGALLFVSSAAFAKPMSFVGVAKEGGKLVYTENHLLDVDDEGRVQTAVTNYVGVDGEVLGTLTSNFQQSLSLPEHLFVDKRTQNQYGVRREGGKLFMFRTIAGKEEETKEVDAKSDADRLLVGGQGFNYYLKDEVENLKKKRKQPILFLIPGDLSTYRFVLEYLGENADKTTSYRVHIESWWLRLFAPSLEFNYDAQLGRIVSYQGISNIKSESGKTMNVSIEYH